MKFTNFFKGLVAMSVAALTLSACNKEAEENTLSVSPATPIEFQATGNEAVILTVETDAASFEVDAPEWIAVEKGGSKAVLTPEDNTGTEERIGRIIITAGTAEPVKIMVSQAAGNGTVNPGESVKASISATEANIYVKSEEAVTFDVTATLSEAAAGDVVIALSVDAAYLSEYNYLNGENFLLFPEAKIAVAGKLTVKAGETSATTTVTLTPEGLAFAQGYLVPLIAKVESGAAVLKGNDARANLMVMRQNPRKIKNVVYIEVNDCNPLNALEYRLTDGTPFYDAVILFAANINYNATDDVVYLSNNPNVQALLDESEVYIQPLRKAGIKVYLGLLGNHDASGLCQLSDWGAAEWAKEVAQACRDYKLDGVNLDDEYSNYPDLSNKWFASPSGERGARLEYELKKALKKTCSWPTEVSHFDWGSLYSFGNVKDQETGEEHTPSEFCDFHVANYGGASYPFGDLTLANCSGASIQLNQYNSISESKAKQCMDDGYGWIMWFAWDPSGTGTVSSNREHSLTQMRNVAKACYNSEIPDPKYVYNKIGEGKYDPEPHAL